MDSFSPWTLVVSDVLKKTSSNEEGLTSEEAENRRKKHGLNELKKHAVKTPLQIFLAQFTNFLVAILIIAAMISLALGEAFDAAFILLIVLINAVFGFVQEYHAENALEALKKLAGQKAKVLRSGKIEVIDSRLLVPGDVIEIEEGDRVPADCRLLESHSLEIIESSLTGESTPVAKNAFTVFKADAQVADRANMIFLGTSVAKGRGKALIVFTGMETEFGKIASMVGKITEEKTPLEEKLNVLGKKLGVGAIAACVIIFALGIAFGQSQIKMFFTSISLLVAAVPEGLPAVVTITLALGVQRMVYKKAVVRKLPAVETLGSTTVICSDKTGTLTKNEMASRLVSLAEEDLRVTETSIVGKGTTCLAMAMKISALCNNASIIGERMNGAKGETHYVRSGDPTELALLQLAKKAGVSKENLKTEFEFVHENSFDSERKAMSVVYRNKQGELMAFVKGAPEKIIARSTHILTTATGETALATEQREKLLEKNNELASRALRVIALAYRKVNSDNKLSEEYIERQLVFVGMVGIIDPPRPEVKNAVELCKQAGIKVVMITGDNEGTALAIGRELGILDGGEVVNGEQLDKMSDEALREKVEKTGLVFARVNPSHKLRIVKAFQANGEIVAMTGDGVNDAPALKKADIGIAMGRTGTEVAREASKMVLLDDNFATIVNAVEEGRKIYDNVAKSVRYLIACNLGEILIIFTATILPSVFRGVMPLGALQILWMNVATDSAPALALGMDSGDAHAMKQPPRNPKEEVINKKNYAELIGTAAIFALVTLGVFLIGLHWNAENTAIASTMAFSTIVLAELFYALSIKSKSPVYARNNIFENKLLVASIAIGTALQVGIVQLGFAEAIFDTVPLTLEQWLIIIVAALIPFTAAELTKTIAVIYKTVKVA